jgi:hypothetical protein
MGDVGVPNMSMHLGQGVSRASLEPKLYNVWFDMWLTMVTLLVLTTSELKSSYPS